MKKEHQEKNFKPSYLLKNKHIQTVYASLFRKLPNLNFRVEIFTLSDGDFVDCYYYFKHAEDSKLVVLFHGLAGSYKSPYIQGTIEKLSQNGFNCVLMHFRGCSGKPNKLPRSYHSGDTQDAKEFVAFLKTKYKADKLFGVGYSLGANMLLKLLGENKQNCLLDAAVAVSPPMKLDICANSINKGFSKYYQYRLVQELNAMLETKYDLFDMNSFIKLKRNDIKNIKTFWEFDEHYTAPVHGFKSAKDYYAKSSSFGYLKSIKIPTLLIHAEDDPFMSKEIIPTKKDVSEFVQLNIQKHGGHVGFVTGSFFKPRYWMEEKIVSYFTSIV